MQPPSRTATHFTSPSCCWMRHIVGAARSQITVWPHPRIASSNRYSASMPAARSSSDSASWQLQAHANGVLTASTTVAGIDLMYPPAAPVATSRQLPDTAGGGRGTADAELTGVRAYERQSLTSCIVAALLGLAAVATAAVLL